MAAEEQVTMQERLTELETRVAFQERTIQQLNDVVVRQSREIERLARELAALTVHVRALTPFPVAGRDEETPPPHY